MNTFASKAGWVMAALASVTLVASWAGAINAGPLDPPGDPASTMKTLDDIPGSWSRLLSSTGGCASDRFDCVLEGDSAVLDRETGIVWERTPSENTLDWDTAFTACRDRNVGGRRGWRAPTVAELQSLLDETTADGLPVDHPFVYAGPNVTFWSSARDTASPAGRSLRVSIDDGTAVNDLNETAHRVWCVRGPGGVDVQ